MQRWKKGLSAMLALLLLLTPALAFGQAHVTKEPKARDGTPVALDLPRSLQLENMGGSDGAGLCVFTSVARAALWANVVVLQGLRDYMTAYPGGGFPEKVVQYVTKICKAKGEPVPNFLQYQGRQLDLIRLAVKTGRMPCVTYGKSPTFRYNGRKIYHMVNVVAAGEGRGPDGKGWWCVSDNNYPGTYEWMSEQQFLTAFVYTGEGWAFFLLAPCPPPVPRKGPEMTSAFFPLAAALLIGQCENGVCKVPENPVIINMIGARQGGHQWGEVASEKAARLYRNNVMVGKFDYVTGTYHEWDGQKFGEAAQSPVPAPISKPGMCEPDGGPCNFGVTLDQTNRANGVFLNGNPISDKQAKAMFNDGESTIGDDTHKKHLTVIVKGAEKRKQFDAWAKSEAAAKKTAGYRLQVYDETTKPSKEMLAPFSLDRDRDFEAKGSVAIVQAPGTTHAATVLAKVYGFGDPDALTNDLRKVDPNFDPLRPIVPVPSPTPAPGPSSISPWWILLGFGAVVVVGAIASNAPQQSKP